MITLKILILEDEIPAYQKLLSYLEISLNNKLKHDWARTNAAGENFLNNNQYDLILSDIQLLDGLSFDLFEKADNKTPIIFCSAYDDYLLKAFHTYGISYILKPYSQKELENALQKYQSLFEGNTKEILDNTTLQKLKTVLSDNTIEYKKRFVIKKPNGIQLINTSDISFIEASGDFCIATDEKGSRHIISSKISVLSNQLNPKAFFKINRSQVVNVTFIESIETHFKNRLLLKMKGVPDKVMTSSNTTASFRKWIES
ncbi:LytTR family DNA-binding domain-containing protein [Aquimarina sp. ERC-38]|uniref:LytR/AlgR family response regulator transcription factor n=1 Tax=Aquimarina sp. ERC-38 TaxID=2949996 RepID=UPI002246E2EC|nr:LytTR family DNA-binding domain-containing protein [Aquimarina sp. ERC-38]UZO81281.1 LytTR family DNA-binding domain-containing protein [Aquimarina sp. ERC-38]